MHILNFLDEAIALETAVASCYEEMGRMAAEESTADRFLKLRDEENNHARVLGIGKDFVRKAPDLFGATVMDEVELRAGLAFTRAILEELQAGRLEFREALTRIRDLEASYERVHMATVVAIKDETLRDLFTRLSRDDRDHVTVLEEILSKSK